MPMPEIDEENRKRPLCYDPEREKFIFFDDIVSGKEKIIPVKTLSESDLKKLVIERWRSLSPKTKVQAISGQPFFRDDVIRAIKQDKPFGKDTLEAEMIALSELLDIIQQNL